jgi:hypothetical protein
MIAKTTGLLWMESVARVTPKILKGWFANYPLSPIFAVLFASKGRKILKNKH